jgi:hypothetical protein
MSEVYKAISLVTAEMSKVGISKDNKNLQQNYKFRGIDDVYGALSPMLAKHMLCILPRVMDRTVTEQQSKSGGILFYTVLRVEFDLVSAKDGSKHTICTVGEAMDSGDKSSNKAMSAAYKYACFQAFCIPTEGDNDADATTHEPMKLDGPTLTPQKRDNYLPEIAKFIESGDDLGLRQLWDELTQNEQAGIWHLLSSKQKLKARELLQKEKVA